MVGPNIYTIAVFPEQCALRSLQNLNTIKIVKYQAARALRDGVDISRHIFVDIENLMLTSDGYRWLRYSGIAGTNLNVWNAELQIIG